MEVYHNGNFRSGRRGSKLAPVPIQRTYVWGGQEILVPAVYVGQAGAALDVCAQIPVADMAAFLKKWPRERRLALNTREDYEQINGDNPGSQDFLAEMSLDDTPLQLSFSSSINWYPEEVFRMGNESLAPAKEGEWTNDLDAEKLMEAYGCSRECCWHFGRLNFNWKGEPILSPRKISLTFQAQPTSVTVGYFTTSIDGAGRLLVSAGQNQAASNLAECRKPGQPECLQPSPGSQEQPELSPCRQKHLQPSIDQSGDTWLSAGQPEPSTASANPAGHQPPSIGFSEEPTDRGRTIKAIHPATGQEYTLTLHECQQTRHGFTEMGAEGILYPEYCQMLSYHITPEISRSLFDIRDCSDGDKPRKKEGSEKNSGTSGASAVFMAGRNPIPERQTAVSSLHFEPVPEVRWRMVFQVLTKPSMEINFAL